VITHDDLPPSSLRVFGEPGSDWIASMIDAVVDGTHQAGRVAMNDDVLEVMNELRDFMFANVYLRPDAEDQRRRAITVIRSGGDYRFANVANCRQQPVMACPDLPRSGVPCARRSYCLSVPRKVRHR
jgi:hypothetical protein